jgi:uncharacterized protein YfdQ (DUF2303 family)
MEFSSSEPAAVRDLHEIVAKLHETDVQTIEDPRTKHEALVAFVPAGRSALDLTAILDAHLPQPRRARGTLTAQDLESFLALVNEFKDTHSRVFAKADPKAPELVAVLDHHELVASDAPGRELLRDIRPRHCEHRVRYACPVSEEWKAWTASNGKLMSQADFADFLEDRIADVVLPDDVDAERVKKLIETLQARLGGPASVMTLSRGLEVNVGTKVKNIVTLASGEITAHFESEHRDAAGEPIKTPNLFFIAIPVFFNGSRYHIAVRLRYRMEGSSLIWFYQMHRPDLSMDDAFRDIVKEVREKTDLTTVLGTPEA